MVDKNDERVLSYGQFAKLMLAVSGTFGMTFDELADQLTWELAKQSDETNEAIMQQIVIAEEAYAKADWSRFEHLPLFRAANRINAYNTYLLMEHAGR